MAAHTSAQGARGGELHACPRLGLRGHLSQHGATRSRQEDADLCPGASGPPLVPKPAGQDARSPPTRRQRWVVLATHEGEARVRAEPFEAIELELAPLWGEDR